MTSEISPVNPLVNSLAQYRVILSHTSHPGNIGSAARAMKTMGIERLYLVQPKLFPHPEAASLASNATDVLENAIVCETLEEALHGCAYAIGLSARKRQLSHELVAMREAGQKAHAVISTGQEVALVFGTEISGLSNRELDLCQLLAMIPTNPNFSSLNLAAAVQVACYEMRMAAIGTQLHFEEEPTPLATNDEVEGFLKHLEDTLIDIGFLNIHSPRKLMPRIRRLFARARLEKEEVNILRGILKLVIKPRPIGRK